MQEKEGKKDLTVKTNYIIGVSKPHKKYKHLTC
jgi:hypothetical protein